MVIYVEYVILGNFFIDAFVAYLTLTLLKMKVSGWRISLAALAGSGFAAVVPYINFAAAGVVKVIMLFIMTAVMSRYPSIKRYILATLLYFAFTAALGGVVIALNSLTVSDIINAMYYPGNLTGAYIAAAAIVLLYIVRQTGGYIAKKRATGSRECKVVLVVGGGEIACEGFIDTGNTLIRGGRGVIVIDRKLADKLIKKGALRTGGIWVKTVSGECYLPAIKIDSVNFPQEKGRSVKDVTAAVSTTGTGEFRVILPAGI